MRYHGSARIELDQDFETKFKKDVLNEIHSKFNKVFQAAVNSISDKLGETVRLRIMSSPEYAGITGGRFRGELGLPDGAARINAIIDRWVESIFVKYTKGTGGSLGSIEIGILQSDWADVLAMGEATLTYTSRKGSNSLEWLRWLLQEGRAVIVSNYEFVPQSKSSRTGLGIMVKGRGGWKIPAQFAGTDMDNFVTRALDGIAQDIDEIVRRELTKVL